MLQPQAAAIPIHDVPDKDLTNAFAPITPPFLRMGRNTQPLPILAAEVQRSNPLNGTRVPGDKLFNRIFIGFAEMRATSVS